MMNGKWAEGSLFFIAGILLFLTDISQILRGYLDNGASLNVFGSFVTVSLA